MRAIQGFTLGYLLCLVIMTAASIEAFAWPIANDFPSPRYQWFGAALFLAWLPFIPIGIISFGYALYDAQPDPQTKIFGDKPE